MNIALLTCDQLKDSTTDESPLAERIIQNCGWDAKWVSWSSTNNWNQYSHAIVRTTWDYTHQRELFIGSLQEIENQGVKLLNPLNIITWNSHKAYLLDLQEKGHSVIPSLSLDHVIHQGFLGGIKKWSQDQILLKPFVGASSQDIRSFADSPQGMESLLKYTKGNTEKWFIQPFYNEILNGEISMIYFNKKLSHALKKVPKPGDFRSQEDYGSQIIPYEPREQECKFASDILDQIAEPLVYARVDFLNIQGSPQLMELELIEPALYFYTHGKSFNNFTMALKETLRSE